MKTSNHLIVLTFASLLFSELIFAKSIETNIAEQVAVSSGDIIKLKGTQVSVLVGTFPGTECAVPGFNCGSGYSPPHLTFTLQCGSLNPCPYIALSASQSATTGTLSIEDEKSCESRTQQAADCFHQFARQYKTDQRCMNLKSPIGRYHCLEMFPASVKPENKMLCDQLPESIYALRWNCYYEYAVRYRDPSFCKKYSIKDLSGKDRCWLKMAELLRNKSFCNEISESKEHTYKEQCSKIKLLNQK